MRGADGIKGLRSAPTLDTELESQKCLRSTDCGSPPVQPSSFTDEETEAQGTFI